MNQIFNGPKTGAAANQKKILAGGTRGTITRFFKTGNDAIGAKRVLGEITKPE